MIFVKVDEWGKCQICGKIEHIRFGICGGPCVKIWESQGKWEWDMDMPGLAKLSCLGHSWHYKEERESYIVGTFSNDQPSLLIEDIKDLYSKGLLVVSICSDTKDNEIIWARPYFYVQANKETLDLLGFKPNFP